MKKGELGPGLVIAIIIGIIILVIVALYFSKNLGEGAARMSAQSQSKTEAAISGCRIAYNTAKTATSCKMWVGLYCRKIYDDKQTCYDAGKAGAAGVDYKNDFGSECTCEEGAVCKVACNAAGEKTSCESWKRAYCSEWYDKDTKCYEAKDKVSCPIKFDGCPC